jgi:inosine-uridine nucleoside N-ribohydrolase
MKILRFFSALAVAAVVMGGVVAARGQGAAHVEPVSAPQLTILDTDIGDDIDDAFALALVLRSPELKLLGVTTAYGDTAMRARLVARYLHAVGRDDVPVLAGVPTARRYEMTQKPYARQWPEQKFPDGVAFLLDQIRAHPGEITLIAIGPLSNIAEAVKRDPGTFRKLKRVVMMGGSVYRGYDGRNGERNPPDAEWNIACDPAGLRALLGSGVPVFMMPLDSTQIHLEAKEREEIFAHGSPLTDQVTLLYHQWMAGSGGNGVPTLFDPVAVTYAVRPDLCPATPLRLEVDEKGFTHPVEGEANAQVCLKSDEKGFLGLLLNRLVTSDPAFSISILAPDTTLATGAPIRLKVAVESHLDRLLILPDFRDGLGLVVRDADGNVLRTTIDWSQSSGSHFGFPVEPGKASEALFDVGRVFDLKKPGQYSLQEQGKDPLTNATLESNFVAIRITP